MRDKNSSYCAVLTTCNSEKTVKRALDSILEQTIPPNEVIIVDDASIDSTLKILKQLVRDIPNVKILENERNSGQSYSRNEAAYNSNSDLLIFFDDDDISYSERAAEHLRMHENGADFSFVSSVKRYHHLYEVVCRNSEYRTINLNPNTMVRRLVLAVHSRELDNVWIPASTSAIRRNFFLSIGGYDLGMRRLEDAEIVIRAALNGCMASWSSKVLVCRSSTTSDTKGGAIEMEYEKQIVLKYQDLLSKKETRRALKLIEIRRAYFTKSYIKLFLLGCTSPNLIAGPNGKLIPFLKRILHDRRRLS